MLFNLANPIPFTPRDPKDLQDFFEEYRVIPYYGTNEHTSHTFLDLLQTLAELSPTFRACRRDLVEYTFGHNVRIASRSIPGLANNDDESEVPFERQQAFVDYLMRLNITLPKLLKLLKRADHHLDVSGNAYFLIRRIIVGDTVKYFMEVPYFRHVAYLYSKDAGEWFLMVSKWMGDMNMLKKHPPIIARATAMGESLRWTQVKRGEEVAIIHMKREGLGDESDYYARPDRLATLTWEYVDFQVGNQNSKVAATEIITKKILAFQAPDPNTLPDGQYFHEENQEIGTNGKIGGKAPDTFQRNMMVLKELVTNLGSHPSILGKERAAGSIAGIEYPHSGVAPKEIDLEINRDTKHQSWQLETATANICAILGWSPELTSLRQAKSNLGGNVIKDIFTIKNESTIIPRQRWFEDFANDVLAQLCDREGGDKEFKNYGIRFLDIVGQMIDKLAGSSSSTPVSPGAGETAAQPNTTDDDAKDLNDA